MALLQFFAHQGVEPSEPMVAAATAALIGWAVVWLALFSLVVWLLVRYVFGYEKRRKEILAAPSASAKKPGKKRTASK